MAARTYHIGTMGWAYPDWRGVFYPTSLPARDYLVAYARAFDAVEVDASFYGMPEPSTIARWCACTPAHFRFALKCPRSVTHERELAEIDAELPPIFEGLRRFGDRLSMFLFQFAPSFHPRHLGRLQRLLDALPRDLPCAIELRHPGWAETQAAALCRQAGVTWTVTDKAPELCLTSDTLYLRLLGDHEWESRFDHVQRDVDNEVESFARRLDSLPSSIVKVLAFVNNHYSGYSPATAARLRALLGLAPPPADEQGLLFPGRP